MGLQFRNDYVLLSTLNKHDKQICISLEAKIKENFYAISFLRDYAQKLPLSYFSAEKQLVQIESEALVHREVHDLSNAKCTISLCQGSKATS